jgi:hypothetical protein
MPEPVMQRLVHRITPASNTPIEVELGPFPLSFLSIDIIRTQPAANANLNAQDMVSFITRVHVHARGVSLFDMNGEEAFIIGQTLVAKKPPWRKTQLGATAMRHIANIIVPFSRQPMSPVSGLPAVGRGEAILRLEFGTVPSGVLLSVHAFGWREHKPEWTLRVVRATANITTTGDNDIPLAIAGSILGFVFEESAPFWNTGTAVLDNLRLLIGGVEDTLNSINFEGLKALEALTADYLLDNIEHLHIENTAGTYTQNATTLTEQHNQYTHKYTFVLLDELFDPDAMVTIPPGVDVRLRVSASATGALFVFPVELFVLPEKKAA